MNFLVKKSKLIHILFGVLCFTLLVSALIYMTQYMNIRVLITKSTSGVVSLGSSGINQNILDFFNKNTGLVANLQDQMWEVYHYNNYLNMVNNLIVTFAMLSLVAFASMIIFGNHSRKVYYKSNLIVGIIVPSIVLVFAIVLMVLNTTALSKLNANSDFYNYVSLLTNEKQGIQLSQRDPAYLQSLFSVNGTSFTLYNVYFAFIGLCSIAMIVYAVYRYLSSAVKRNEVIAKAVQVSE